MIRRPSQADAWGYLVSTPARTHSPGGIVFCSRPDQTAAVKFPSRATLRATAEFRTAVPLEFQERLPSFCRTPNQMWILTRRTPGEISKRERKRSARKVFVAPGRVKPSAAAITVRYSISFRA